MKLLLDTHVLLWWLADDPRLGVTARALIAAPENEICVSVAALWEIVIKVRIGKLRADAAQIEQAIARAGFTRMPITPAHLSCLATLPTHHRDPFDHLLIAQALTDAAVFVSGDRHVPLYLGHHQFVAP